MRRMRNDANDAKRTYSDMPQGGIVFADLSYQITGLFLETQKRLGRFARERQYADYLEILLKREGISYSRESVVVVAIGPETMKSNRCDFVIDGKLLVEVKTVPYLSKRDYYQTMRYLRAANLRLGLLVNFRSEYLKPKRILNSSHHSHS